MITKQLYGDIFSATATHATAAAASVSAVTGKSHYITDIAASSDKAGSILLVKQGTTVIWQMQVGAGALSFQFSSPLKAPSNTAVSVEIDGTSACKANISGFTA